jgi:hypothetical protein
VLYLDSSKALTVIQGAGKHVIGDSSLQLMEGLSVQLPAAGSDVATVAPLLELHSSSSSGNGNGIGSSSSSINFAVVGLTNMLNPGGSVKSVSIIIIISSSSGMPGGSDGGSSSSSDSWVVAEGDESAAAAAAGGNGRDGPAKDAATDPTAAAAGGDGAVLHVSLLGCGQLLLYASCSPTTVLLDGHPVAFAFNSSGCSLVVQVPEPAGDSAKQARELQHSVALRFG